MFHLFISHVSTRKIFVAELKTALSRLGIASFVAHEDIDPSLEWQTEIETALHSMHAMCAILTSDFPGSKWTDQEVGFALARGVLVIPVKMGIDPYGFLGKYQAISAVAITGNALKLASKIVSTLIKNASTMPLITDALVDALCKSRSFDASKVVMTELELISRFSSPQLEKIKSALENGQVSAAFGVPERISSVLTKSRS